VESPSYRQWDAVELTADNRRMLYMPEGVAHGYLTLTDDVEASYYASSPWSPQAESGARWDDPAFGIRWPFEPVVISEKDRSWPLQP
jgi:dTDP-4-dehydrorhamnose 3,5-epimerase